MMMRGVVREHVLVGWLMKMMWLECYQPIWYYITVYVQVKYVVKEPAAGAVYYDQSSHETEIHSLTTLTEVNKQNNCTVYSLWFCFVALRYVCEETDSLTTVAEINKQQSHLQ